MGSEGLSLCAVRCRRLAPEVTDDRVDVGRERRVAKIDNASRRVENVFDRI